MRETRRHKKKNHRFTIIFPILTIIVIGIVFALSSFYEKSWSYNWNGIGENIRDSVLIAQNDFVTDQKAKNGQRSPNQYNRRSWIMKNATENELLKLTNYPNGTIKTIAYEGLLRKKGFQNRVELVLKSIAETEYPMAYQSGCLVTQMNISEYLVNSVLYINDEGPPSSASLNNPFRFSENEIQSIMSEYRKVQRFRK